MEVDELQRRRLFNDLDRAIGPDSAAVLMAHLPPTGWSDLATKQDLGVLRRDLDVLRRETTAEFEGLRVATTQALESLRSGLTADLRRELIELTHRLYFGMAGLFVGVGTLAIGAAALVR